MASLKALYRMSLASSVRSSYLTLAPSGTWVVFSCVRQVLRGGLDQLIGANSPVLFLHGNTRRRSKLDWKFGGANERQGFGGLEEIESTFTTTSDASHPRLNGLGEGGRRGSALLGGLVVVPTGCHAIVLRMGASIEQSLLSGVAVCVCRWWFVTWGRRSETQCPHCHHSHVDFDSAELGLEKTPPDSLFPCIDGDQGWLVW